MIRKLSVKRSRYQVYSSLFKKKTWGFVALGMNALTRLITNVASVLSPLAWHVPLVGISRGQVSGT